MGLLGKSIKEKILDIILLAIDEDEPSKDKFLFFYRVCQFDVSFNFNSENELETLKKYKNEPIFPDQYKNLKSHLKAIYIVMFEISMFIAKRDNLISKPDYDFVFKNIDEKLEKIDPKAKKLIKHYQEISDNSMPIMPSKLSEESFENKLEMSLRTLQDWSYISRDLFRQQIEQILGTQLSWEYRYTGE